MSHKYKSEAGEAVNDFDVAYAGGIRVSDSRTQWINFQIEQLLETVSEDLREDIINTLHDPHGWHLFATANITEHHTERPPDADDHLFDTRRYQEYHPSQGTLTINDRIQGVLLGLRCGGARVPMKSKEYKVPAMPVAHYIPKGIPSRPVLQVRHILIAEDAVDPLETHKKLYERVRKSCDLKRTHRSRIAYAVTPALQNDLGPSPLESIGEFHPVPTNTPAQYRESHFLVYPKDWQQYYKKS